MSIITRLEIYFNYIYLEEDQYGNRYYVAKKARNIDSGEKKRIVLYRGINEPSKVPVIFHAWLHYLISTEELKRLQSEKHAWQKERKPNSTGTKFAKFPSGHISYSKNRDKVSSDYKAWQPDFIGTKNE